MGRAVSRALPSAGNSIPARMAMMAMTTSSSIKVKPPVRWPHRRVASREVAMPCGVVVGQSPCQTNA